MRIFVVALILGWTTVASAYSMVPYTCENEVNQFVKAFNCVAHAPNATDALSSQLTTCREQLTSCNARHDAQAWSDIIEWLPRQGEKLMAQWWWNEKGHVEAVNVAFMFSHMLIIMLLIMVVMKRN